MQTGVTDPNEARFDAVRKYLTDNFPEADIPPPSDFEGAGTGRVFFVEESYDVRQLELGRSVYEDRSVVQLVTLLEAHTVAETMRMNPERRLLMAPVWDGRVTCSLEDLRA
jgi:hypothetical protein